MEMVVTLKNASYCPPLCDYNLFKIRFRNLIIKALVLMKVICQSNS